ncbi:OTU11 [Symbiodinium natans]|uniref:OTU11 protein n=1 Tax=Symbiodinium natans TaxID=878477 RepID=A0A812R787_9DINO|nr:OTU11 [Symbiodinium natans]
MGTCASASSERGLQSKGSSFISNASDVIDRLEAADGQENLVLVASRKVDSEAIRSQRVEAAVASRGINQFARRSPTRTALDDPPGPTMRNSFQKMATSLRMSRMGTMKREQMIQEVAAAAPEQGLKGASLETRLATFGMQMLEMEGDGNCQFRSMAFNLFGQQDYHASPRQAAVRHMKKHSDFFGVFFEDQAEFSRYLQNMARNGTWGDELTLRAVVEAYGCIAHVVTSEPANWHLVYEPEGPDAPDLDVAVCPKGMGLPKSRKRIFLSYISPIHYNAIISRPH